LFGAKISYEASLVVVATGIHAYLLLVSSAFCSM
jgi:hypothetical protein